MMKWRVEQKLIAGGFGLTILLTGMLSFISYQNAARLAESTEKVKQTHEVLETLVDVLATLNDAESGRRGYILLKDKSELKRYNLAIQKLELKLNQLQNSVKKDSQQKQLEELQSLIAQRLLLSQQQIILFQKGVSFKSIDNFLAKESKLNWDSIQQAIDQMQLEEQTALDVRFQQSQSSIQSRMLIEMLGSFCTFTILFGVYAQLYRQMTKRQQAEALQHKLLQEKELGELKLQFFSMASHEFRTPLSIILGSAQLLEESLPTELERQKLKNLYRIQSSARLMTQLLSDILTLARAEAGKLEYKAELVEMQSFCLNLIEDIQTLSESRRTIKFDKHGSSTHASVDEKLLYSILSNLLSNAIKYSPQGKEICFTLRCEPEAVTFHIKDEGIGIPKETISQLYEPFQRGGNVRGIMGTGLGLAVVKKCLDLHQGEISVESEVGVGSIFTVTIPQNIE
ncbi:MAG: ATP-binding protein [Scytonema sp. PMC 1069.18]|nr:ATP-binding protein [Scytonema sp. PMC 1069.18]MEC4884625.1 ATP-binding protein [Scytonema sp. PMC 1070.18]